MDGVLLKYTGERDKIPKMTFQQGGKIFIDKIEDKYRFYWNDDGLI